MAYVPLSLTCPDPKVAQAISMATEHHLEQAHYLLAASYSDGSSPHAHFGTAAAVMTLLTIAATSAIRYFNPKTNSKTKGDRAAFVECVRTFFPWDQVTVQDDLHRPARQHRRTAAEELYSVFRNPLVHSGGVVSKWHRAPRIAHIYPGLASLPENEGAIAELCGMNTYCGQTLLEMRATG